MAFGEASLPESSITIDGFIYSTFFFAASSIGGRCMCRGQVSIASPCTIYAELRKLLYKKCF